MHRFHAFCMDEAGEMAKKSSMKHLHGSIIIGSKGEKDCRGMEQVHLFFK